MDEKEKEGGGVRGKGRRKEEKGVKMEEGSRREER